MDILKNQIHEEVKKIRAKTQKSEELSQKDFSILLLSSLMEEESYEYENSRKTND